MTSKVLFIFCCALLTTQSAAQNTNSCYSNGTKCLSDLRQLLVDTNRFWFGSSYQKACPGGSGTSPECANPYPTRKSILSRLLALDDTDPTLNVTAQNMSLVNITYTAPAGNYYACGHYYEVPEISGHLIDPLVITRVSLWSVSYEPTVTWTPKTQDSLETLVFWDPGNSYSHGLYVNCKNGSTDTGEVVMPYLGPLNPYLRANTYVFAVYAQTGPIDVSDAKRFVEGPGTLEPWEFIANFTSRNNNPTHAGVLTIVADPYSLQKIYDRFYMANNCPYLISQLDVFHAVVQASNLTVSWSDNTTTMSLYSNGTYLKGLTTNIDVRYYTDDYSVESCCSNYSLTRGTTLVDPFTRTTVRPGSIRLKPTVQLTPIELTALPGIAGEAYTLFLLDVAAALSPSASEPVYVTHWLVTNIRNADVIRGDEVAPYFAPNPFTANDHRPYIFLLFRQPVETLNNTIFSTFCPNGITLR
ncbi:hypothetical protein BsWGS_07973 [Bradybaena similaris]